MCTSRYSKTGVLGRIHRWILHRSVAEITASCHHRPECLTLSEGRLANPEESVVDGVAYERRIQLRIPGGIEEIPEMRVLCIKA